MTLPVVARSHAAVRSLVAALANTHLPRGTLHWLAAAAVLLALIEIGRSPLLDELKPHWPIESVGVRGELRHLAREQLEAVISTSLAEDFFAVDVLALRNAAMNMSWVRDASVRRIWPGRVEIHVTERVAVARWGDASLIDEHGTLFTPDTLHGLETLPRLHGPMHSEAKVLREFRAVHRMLKVLDLQVTAAGVDARGNWQVDFDSGLTLVLGAEPLDLARRVAQASQALGERLRDAARIDLRYANGFAVRWRSPDAPGGSDNPQGKADPHLALQDPSRAVDGISSNGASR